MAMTEEGSREFNNMSTSGHSDRYSDEQFARQLDKFTLDEALRMRDRLLFREGGRRRSDSISSSLEAAKRLGRLQAQIFLLRRE